LDKVKYQISLNKKNKNKQMLLGRSMQTTPTVVYAKISIDVLLQRQWISLHIQRFI
jgi:hypothetical protein